MNNDFVNSMPCGMVTLSTDLVILDANVAFCTLIDGPLDDIIGTAIETFMTASARIYLHTHLFPTLQLSGSVTEAYLSLRSVSGDPVPVLMNSVRNSGDETSKILCAFVKIDQRDRWELETHKARRAAEDERDRHRETAARLAEALVALQASVDEVNRTHWLLRRVAEVLPICMGCAKVKPGPGDWESVADFLRTNSKFLSHGYCPSCADEAAREWGLEPPDLTDS